MISLKPYTTLGDEIQRAFASPDIAGQIASCRVAEPDTRELFSLLGRDGLLAPHWPGRYGGRDASFYDTAFVAEQLMAAGVSDTLHVLTVQVTGNLILMHGTDEQKERLLPGLARGRAFASVLFSEPSVGSDVAATSTLAVRLSEAHWRFTGHKRFGAKLPLADYGLVLARTDEGDYGLGSLTLFCMPLELVGVHFERLEGLYSEHLFDIFLDGVIVDDCWRIGPVGGAWPIISKAVNLERTGLDYWLRAVAWLKFLQDCNTDRLYTLTTQCDAAGALVIRAIGDLGQRASSDALFAAAKYYCSETARSVARSAILSAETSGEPSSFSPTFGLASQAWRDAACITLSAGSSEMMLKIVASSELDPVGPGASLRDTRALETGQTDLVHLVDSVSDTSAPSSILHRLGRCSEYRALLLPQALDNRDASQVEADLSCHFGRRGLDRRLVHAPACSRLRTWTGHREASAVLQAEIHRKPDDMDLAWTGNAYQMPCSAVTEHSKRIWRFSVGDTRISLRFAADPVPIPSEPHDSDSSSDRTLASEAAGFLRRDAWYMIGLAEAAIDHSIAYTSDRHAFSRQVIGNQVVSFALSHELIALTACRELLSLPGGHEDIDSLRTLAKRRQFIKEQTMTAIERAVHWCGAFGTIHESRVARLFISALCHRS